MNTIDAPTQTLETAEITCTPNDCPYTTWPAASSADSASSPFGGNFETVGLVGTATGAANGGLGCDSGCPLKNKYAVRSPTATPQYPYAVQLPTKITTDYSAIPASTNSYNPSVDNGNALCGTNNATIPNGDWCNFRLTGYTCESSECYAGYWQDKDITCLPNNCPFNGQTDSRVNPVDYSVPPQPSAITGSNVPGDQPTLIPFQAPTERPTNANVEATHGTQYTGSIFNGGIIPATNANCNKGDQVTSGTTCEFDLDGYKCQASYCHASYWQTPEPTCTEKDCTYDGITPFAGRTVDTFVANDVAATPKFIADRTAADMVHQYNTHQFIPVPNFTSSTGCRPGGTVPSVCNSHLPTTGVWGTCDSSNWTAFGCDFNLDGYTCDSVYCFASYWQYRPGQQDSKGWDIQKPFGCEGCGINQQPYSSDTQTLPWNQMEPSGGPCTNCPSSTDPENNVGSRTVSPQCFENPCPWNNLPKPAYQVVIADGYQHVPVNITRAVPFGIPRTLTSSCSADQTLISQAACGYKEPGYVCAPTQCFASYWQTNINNSFTLYYAPHLRNGVGHVVNNTLECVEDSCDFNRLNYFNDCDPACIQNNCDPCPYEPNKPLPHDRERDYNHTISNWVKRTVVSVQGGNQTGYVTTSSSWEITSWKIIQRMAQPSVTAWGGPATGGPYCSPHGNMTQSDGTFGTSAGWVPSGYNCTFDGPPGWTCGYAAAPDYAAGEVNRLVDYTQNENSGQHFTPGAYASHYVNPGTPAPIIPTPGGLVDESSSAITPAYTSTYSSGGVPATPAPTLSNKARQAKACASNWGPYRGGFFGTGASVWNCNSPKCFAEKWNQVDVTCTPNSCNYDEITPPTNSRAYRPDLGCQPGGAVPSDSSCEWAYTGNTGPLGESGFRCEVAECFAGHWITGLRYTCFPNPCYFDELTVPEGAVAFGDGCEGEGSLVLDGSACTFYRPGGYAYEPAICLAGVWTTLVPATLQTKEVGATAENSNEAQGHAQDYTAAEVGGGFAMVASTVLLLGSIVMQVHNLGVFPQIGQNTQASDLGRHSADMATAFDADLGDTSTMTTMNPTLDEDPSIDMSIDAETVEMKDMNEDPGEFDKDDAYDGPMEPEEGFI